MKEVAEQDGSHPGAAGYAELAESRFGGGLPGNLGSRNSLAAGF